LVTTKTIFVLLNIVVVKNTTLFITSYYGKGASQQFCIEVQGIIIDRTIPTR